MSLIYYYAAILNGIVLGTGDKSEISLGYFTKYGDGAADILPIADLYKTEVRALARYLSIPDEIISKKAVPDYGKVIPQRESLALPMTTSI
jgi:NAD+ synthase